MVSEPTTKEDNAMGLDITAYRNLKKIDCLFDAEGHPVDRNTGEEVDYDLHVYANHDFPKAHDGIEDRCVYKADDSFGFRAGSYGGYNAWRNQLAKLGGWPEGIYEQYNREYKSYCCAAWDGQEGPFAELINFSDCEGIIGPVVSAKLAKDFSDFESAAVQVDHPFFQETYRNFKLAFEVASDGGAVDFH